MWVSVKPSGSSWMPRTRPRTRSEMPAMDGGPYGADEPWHLDGQLVMTGSPCATEGWSVSLLDRRGVLGVIRRRNVFGTAAGRRPTGQQGQGVLRGRARLGGVGNHALAGIAGQRGGLERQVDVADDRVVDELHPGAVDPDVVRGPPDSEVVAAGGELPDQVGDSPLVWIAAGPGAQQAAGAVPTSAPLAEELVRLRS